MKIISDILFTRLLSTIALGLWFVAGTLNASAVQPWESWARNPLTIPVTVLVTDVQAGAGAGVTVTLEEVQVVVEGAGDGTPVNGSPATAQISVRREYNLTVVATDFSSMNLQLDPIANWTPLASSGRAARPKEYHVMIDRELADDGIQISNPSGNGSYNETFVVEITERLPWRLEDGSDDPMPAPGDAKWAEIGPGKSLDKAKTAISWSVSLGRLMDGIAAGRLTLRESGLSAAIYTPASLYYTAGSSTVRDEVELITTSPTSVTLRQVKAYQTLVDIVALANSTQLSFYLSSQVGSQNANGIYTLNGSPFVVWEILNPQPGSATRLHIIERRDGVDSITEIIYNPNSATATWTLKYGTPPEVRVETRGVEITSPRRYETVDVRYLNDTTPSYHCKETYRLMPWGLFELVETVIENPDNDPATADNLVTAFSFYETDPQNQMTYKRLKSITYPDGSWERRIYEADSMLVLRPHKDTPMSPDTATFADSEVTKYSLGGNIESYRPPYDPETGSLKPFRWLVQDRGPKVGTVQAEVRLNGSWIIDPNGSLMVPTKLMSHSLTGYDESYGFGAYTHPLVEIDSVGPAKVLYHNSVTYDPASGTYDVHPLTPLSQGPDWRQCTLTTFLQPDVFDDELSDILTCHIADSRPLYDPVDFEFEPPRFFRNRTMRESEIYHKGSLSLKEKHVLIGELSGEPVFEPICKWIYENDSLGHPIRVTWVDARTGVSRVTFSADYKGNNDFDGILKLWETDEQGIKTVFEYDGLKRLKSARKEVPGGVDVVTSYTYDAVDRLLTETVAASGLAVGTSRNLDLSGRVISQTDTNGLTTSYIYELGGRRVVKTLPNTKTEIRENYRDGRLKSVTGTGVIHEYHTWEHASAQGDGTDPFTVALGTLHTIRLNAADSPRVIWEGLDWTDRPILIKRPDWVSGQTIRDYHIFDWDRPALFSTTYRTVGADETFVQATKFNFDGSTNATSGFADAFYLDPTPYDFDSYFGSDHRITRQNSGYQKIENDWFYCTTNLVYRENSDATPTVTGRTQERLNGFSSGDTLSEVRSWDADNNPTTVTTTVDQSSRKVTEVTTVAFSSKPATRIMIDGLLRSESSHSVSQPVEYGYDALERLTSVVNRESFPAAVTYNANDQIETSTDFAGITTTYTYYQNGELGAGQVKSESVAGRETYRSYTDRGELHRVWGDVPYPEEREYTAYGELRQLRTFKAGSGWTGVSWPGDPGPAQNTTWTYDPASGLLASKADHLGRTVTFTYNYGLLKTRKWARNSTATYAYNELGELTGIDYSDTTPDVAYVRPDVPELSTLNRRGLPLVSINASGEWRLTYDHADRVTGATCVDGLHAGITVTNHFDPVQGRDWLKVRVGEQDVLQHNYEYDSDSGRLETVSYDNYSATYAYRPNSDLLQTVTSENGTEELIAAYGWEYGVRLKSIQNSAAGQVLSRHTYSYDDRGRRWRATIEDSSRWDYGYNDRNEVTSGKRYWSDGTAVAGQQYEYGYDTIGNREYTRSGGDSAGNNLRYADYTPDDLNQYSARQVPGTVDITGLAPAGQAVRVNGQNAGRHFDYYAGTTTLNSGATPAWETVTVELLGAGAASSSGEMAVPGATESFDYDLDGNLQADALWTYGWDGENRLVRATRKAISGIPDEKRKQLTFAYDDWGRRISKTVETWDGVDAFSDPVTTKFVYDGWNLIAELDANNQVIRSYLWGIDMSGGPPSDEQRAAGIGGLLLVTDHSLSSSHFPAYDGNGNVTLLVNAATVKPSARYEYGPFGELIRATGPMARINPFRWSTRYWDEESDLVYYGYRFYSPTLGRWISRDPIEEGDTRNLYILVRNRPIDLFDLLGAMTLIEPLLTSAEEFSDKAIEIKRGESIISRVRDVIQRSDNLQQFMAGVMEAQDTDITDLLLSIDAAKGSLFQNLRGESSGKKATALLDDLHHVFPQAKSFANFFGKNGINVDGALSQMNGFLHRYGVHSPGGGPYNEVWLRFQKKHRNMKNNPYYVLGFGFGLFDKIDGKLL